MNGITYYMPVASTSLAVYFSSACIKASKYCKNRLADIQDRIDNAAILLTSKRGTKETDCCLEIILTDNEKQKLKPIGDGCWFLMDSVLPITRIRRILFSNQAQMETTITNIEISTAFIPKGIATVVDGFDDNPLPNDMLSDAKIEHNDYNDILKRFDKYLGALALMRIVHDETCNYSKNYIATLSFFNARIKREYEESGPRKEKSQLQEFFKGSGGPYRHRLKYIDSVIDDRSVGDIASEEGTQIKKKVTGLYDLDSLDGWTYRIAVLNTYGVGDESKKKRIDELIVDRFRTIKKGEGTAFCYGYNRGYSVFSKQYKTVEMKSPIDFKYKMDSQLDYYTIESVYQYVFNGVESDSFAYLDSWCPKQQPKNNLRSNEYKILDEVIIGKKKAVVFSDEWWIGFQEKCGITFQYVKQFINEQLAKTIRQDIVDEVKDNYDAQLIAKQEELDKKDSEIESMKERLARLKEEKSDLESTIQDKEKQIAQQKKENEKITGQYHEAMAKLEECRLIQTECAPQTESIDRHISDETSIIDCAGRQTTDDEHDGFNIGPWYKGKTLAQVKKDLGKNVKDSTLFEEFIKLVDNYKTFIS